MSKTRHGKFQCLSLIKSVSHDWKMKKTQILGKKKGSSCVIMTWYGEFWHSFVSWRWSRATETRCVNNRTTWNSRFRLSFKQCCCLTPLQTVNKTTVLYVNKFTVTLSAILPANHFHKKLSSSTILSSNSSCTSMYCCVLFAAKLYVV